MKKVLTTPITYEQIKDLTIGDTVYLTGPEALAMLAANEKA